MYKSGRYVDQPVLSSADRASSVEQTQYFGYFYYKMQCTRIERLLKHKTPHPLVAVTVKGAHLHIDTDM